MLLNSYLYKKSIRNNNNYKNHNYFLSLVPKINIDSLNIYLLDNEKEKIQV